MIGRCSASGMVLLVFASGGLVTDCGAHPAHAKPVNYPYVVGFERFHSSLDDDDYLSEGGFILLNELNCVACHEPPDVLRNQLSGLLATDLRGVASRLDPVNLEIMIRNPRFMKRDTIMPSLFAGPDRDLEEVEALKHYLATLTTEIPEYEVGDLEAGRVLYHRIGCASCHAPEAGYRPAGVPDHAEIELAGLPSVPMNLADLYPIDALTHFLLDPNRHRPSGRMPDFNLTEKEAIDLAAYLKAGPDLVLPENLTQALEASETFTVDEELATRGKQLFRSKRCSACHEDPTGGAVEPQVAVPSLAELDPEATGGCFSSRPVAGGVPFYGLDEVQKRAISAALVRLDARREFDLVGEIDWRMKRLNCYACHERGGVGGAETAREVYFGFSSEEAVELGRWGNLPPTLDRVGARLTEDWLRGVLLRDERKPVARKYLVARMPSYLDETVEPFIGQFVEADRGEQEKAPENGEVAEGADLVSVSGRNCVECHSVGEVPSSRLPGIDLSLAPRRLQREWFDSLLEDPQAMLPAVPMANTFENEDAAAAAADIWKFLEKISAESRP